MPIFDENHVKICGCVVVWDGVTRPDTYPDGGVKYSLKVVVEPTNPDLMLFQELSQRVLQQSKFKGVLPAGGLMPIGVAGPQEFGGAFAGFGVISAKSKFVPDVYDENGQKLDPMQYGNMLYPGQRVDVLLHCYDYDKAGNKGVSAGIDGLAIIASAQAARLEISGGVNTASAFGGGGQQQPAQQPPAFGQQQPAQQPGFMPGGGVAF